MRKFNFLSFLIGVIAVGGVGAFALSSQYLKSDGTPNFQELKSTANKNRLNAEMRDQLMDGLSKMQEKIPTTNGETIPAGAVMAFNLSSCPDGWSPFTEANDRFIMGSQANLREKGGNSEIQLTIGQLPPHFFYLFWNYSGQDADDKHNPFVGDYQYTSTKRSYVPHNWDSKNQYYINSTRNTPDRWKTNTLGSWNSINIQNPYIKLLYCVKGKPEPTKNKTTDRT